MAIEASTQLKVNGNVSWNSKRITTLANPVDDQDAATKAYVASAAPAISHTHAQADVTDLVDDLAAKAPLVSPALTGTPTVPTAAPSTGGTQAASCGYADAGDAATLAAAAAYTDAHSGDGAQPHDARLDAVTQVTRSGIMVMLIPEPALGGEPLGEDALPSIEPRLLVAGSNITIDCPDGVEGDIRISATGGLTAAQSLARIRRAF